MANQKTYSDELFEKYLISQSLRFDYEKDCEIREKQGKKTPDYTIYYDSQELIADVKEFDNRNLIGKKYISFKLNEEIKPIKNKIQEAAKQFKDLKDKCCSLVLHSHDHFIANNIRSPEFVYRTCLQLKP